MKKILLALLVIGISVVMIAGFIPEKILILPVGCAQNQSTYVTMKDGTKIAVRISLPYGMKKNDKVPTIMETTRYGTKYKKTFLLNALFNLGIGKEVESIFYETLLKSNYALIRVDARGSGASSGNRDMEWSKEEINDMNQIIEWITKQSWSNGKVGTYGISYSGNTAELAMISNNKALLASAPLYPDFNPMKQNVLPGGIFNEVLVKKWSKSNKAMDANVTDIFNGGVAPVDNDKNEKILKQAIAEHKTIDIYELVKNITFFDDNLTHDYKAKSLSPYIYKKEIQKSKVPIYVRVGWHDAGTVNGAIERYLTYNNKQELIIGPWSHGGYHFFDPFKENASIEEEIYMQRKELETIQAKEVISFFDAYLKEGKNSNRESQIRYYTLGEGKWKSTNTWPVKGFDNKILYFNSDKKLSYEKSKEKDGSDIYKVDFTATTGKSNRWFTNIGGGLIYYPDRAEEDNKLLTYTSDPLEYDTEITGVPIVNLNVSSNTTDGAFYVYLEDVAPDGKVTYITEGQLRAIHRKVTKDELDYTSIGPKHSFEKKDVNSLTPGQNTEIKIGMYATSVLIKKGHSIRIAIAGHDSANFNKVPSDNEDVTIEVQRNNILSSYVELPMKIRD